MAEISEDAALGMLEGAFGNAPKAAPAPKPVAAPEPEAEAPEEIEAAPAPDDGDDEAEPQEAAAPVAEPEFEIEVNGHREIVKGAEQVKELLQKGKFYQTKTEEIARARDAIIAQYQQQEVATKFQQEVMPDVTELQALDKALAEYSNYDWATAIDTDFIQANKLQMQWSRLKEMRQEKAQQLSAKHQQFQQAQAQAGQQVLIAEHNALLAKLPAWRNSETANAEKQAIGKALRDDYGYQDAELTLLTDHRAMLVARDAMKWRELQRGKAAKVGQLRDAPPVNKPGAAQSQQDRTQAGFAKQVQDFRKAGRAGNHRAQETSLEKMLSRTFK